LAWELASWPYEVSKSAGYPHLENWQQPWGIPWCICWSLPLYNLPHLDIALQWCWSTRSGLCPEITDPWG
jgi:hypothetical protein